MAENADVIIHNGNVAVYVAKTTIELTKLSREVGPEGATLTYLLEMASIEAAQVAARLAPIASGTQPEVSTCPTVTA